MSPLDDFLTALATQHHRLTWQLAYPDRIRAMPPPGTPVASFCPLTAMAWLTHGVTISSQRAYRAAQLLGLSLVDAQQIMTAADFPARGQNKAAPLRARLLACLGLEETTL
jgi:hypothetical protein